jgi:hypothetical protein
MGDFLASSQDIFFMTRFGPTQLIQFGLKDLATSRHLKPFESVTRIIFVVPGNPGSIEMYRYFMQVLHQECQLPVIGLSHPGMIREGISRFQGPLTIRKIVEHKLDFIESFIPSDVEIVLVGHSIGTFITVQMMRCAHERSRFLHNVMVMPVLEKFTSLPGWNTVRILYLFRYMIYGIVFVLSLLRDDILTNLFPKVMTSFSRRTPFCAYSGVLQLVNWNVLRNILFLTQDEANQVQERDDFFLTHNLPKLSFIYCVDDHWAPLRSYRSLKKKFPDADFVILDTIEHSFVLDSKQTLDVSHCISTRIKSLPKSMPSVLALTVNEDNSTSGTSSPPMESTSSWSEPSNIDN